MKVVSKGLAGLIELLELDVEGCLEYKYRLNVSGYSRPKLSTGKQVFAHRFSYCWNLGKSVDSISGWCIMHTCDNPCCVNPKHLVLGSWGDNNRDRKMKRRTVVSHSRRKLTREQVEEIKRRYNPNRDRINGVSALSREFGVDANVIYKAVEGGYDDWSETKTV